MARIAKESGILREEIKRRLWTNIRISLQWNGIELTQSQSVVKTLYFIAMQKALKY